eukprot:7369099-Alexandrium_andersonii.AAC.1
MHAAAIGTADGAVSAAFNELWTQRCTALAHNVRWPGWPVEEGTSGHNKLHRMPPALPASRASKIPSKVHAIIGRPCR